MKKLGTLGFSIESSMMSAQTPQNTSLDRGLKSTPRRSKVKQARKQKPRK